MVSIKFLLNIRLADDIYNKSVSDKWIKSTFILYNQYKFLTYCLLIIIEGLFSIHIYMYLTDDSSWQWTHYMTQQFSLYIDLHLPSMQLFQISNSKNFCFVNSVNININTLR